jgi:preprotein translocase subunit Sec61beta
MLIPEGRFAYRDGNSVYIVYRNHEETPTTNKPFTVINIMTGVVLFFEENELKEILEELGPRSVIRNVCITVS